MSLHGSPSRGWRVHCLLGLVLLVPKCIGHIRLTYPAARTYQFDFLDNVRTPGPCGMPAGLDERYSNLQAGDILDISWHLSYPHKGGYYFEIRDNNGSVKSRDPVSGFVGNDDGTSLQHKLQLPGERCDKCFLRMVRQAAEWGKNYLFWSCADINIKPSPELSSSDRCSGHGLYQFGQCSCEKMYKGDKCQFKEECDTDLDCGQQGVCLDVMATSYPKHQCYCKPGWFGPQCQYQSSITRRPTDLNVYESRTLSADSDVTVYYRTVQDEVEVVLKVRTASWVAFGWRPAGIRKQCQNFPDLGGGKYALGGSEGQAEPEGEGEPEGEPEGVAEGEPIGEGAPEGEAEGHAEEADGKPASHAEGEPESHAEGEPESHAEGEPEGHAEGEPEGHAEGEPVSHAEGEPESHAEGEPERHAEGEPERHAEGEPESHAEREPESHAEGEPESHAEGEPERHADRKPKRPPSSASSGLHPMDCTDIVIGSARDDYSRIGDYYTRDRSTPVHDEYLGGHNSLTAGLVWQDGPYTLMIFRRKFRSDDSADHNVSNEATHVIWAFGQAQGNYNHYPASALESKLSVSIPDFYKQDELKYHGHNGQRGAATLNFFSAEKNDKSDEDENCMRGSCAENICTLDFFWTYDDISDQITFNISASNVQANQWIALGFSDDTSMPDTDVIYGGIGQDGKPFVKDGWLYGRQPPRDDRGKQDVQLLEGQYVDNRLTLLFTRSRTTNDADDKDLSKCLYLFFARGGRITSNGISKHLNTPYVSLQPVCFGHCRQSTVKYVTPITIRLSNVQFQEAYRDPNSAEYRMLASSLKNDLEDYFKGQLSTKFQSIDIKAIRPGSIIVDFDVVSSSADYLSKAHHEIVDTANELPAAMKDTYGLVQIVTVAETHKAGDNMEEDKDMLTTVEIIIIVIIIILVLVAVIIGVCKFLEMRRSRKKKFVMDEASYMSSRSGTSTMTYGEFIAMKQQPLPHPSYGNPGYDSAGHNSNL